MNDTAIYKANPAAAFLARTEVPGGVDWLTNDGAIAWFIEATELGLFGPHEALDFMRDLWGKEDMGSWLREAQVRSELLAQA